MNTKPTQESNSVTMCVGKSYNPGTDGNNATMFELFGYRRCGIYAVIQIIFMFLGALTIIYCHHILHTNYINNMIIGASIIIICNLLPNGKPFFVNFYQIGRVYILFDGSHREVTLIQTRLAGLRVTKTIICSYSQFRGIAIHNRTKQTLFLCQREESLLLSEVWDVLPRKSSSIEDILSEISLFWFQYNQCNAFFGMTFVDFCEGIVAEGNVHLNVEYDYFLKSDDEWKPKNDMLNEQPHILKMEHVEDMALDRDQLLEVKKKDKKRFDRFHSVNGPSMTINSEHEPICDYV